MSIVQFVAIYTAFYAGGQCDDGRWAAFWYILAFVALTVKVWTLLIATSTSTCIPYYETVRWIRSHPKCAHGLVVSAPFDSAPHGTRSQLSLRMG